MLNPVTSGAQQAQQPMPPNQPDRGLVYDGLERDAAVCPRAFKVKGSQSCTHGPDPMPVGKSVKTQTAPLVAAAAAAPAAAPTHCHTDGITGKRVQVIYAAPPGVDRYSAFLASIRTWAAAAEEIYVDSAAETGEIRRIRWVHNATCDISVSKAFYDQAKDDDTFAAMVTELTRQGATRTDRKYLVFQDSNIFCGLANIKNDDQPGPANANNGGPTFTRIDNGCWGGEVPAHELMHTIGGVQLSAPRSTGWDGNNGYHCYDEYDRMCYNDGATYFDNGGVLTFPCNVVARNRLFDCGHNDYYTTANGGAYLGSKWNTAKSQYLRTDGFGASNGDFNGDGRDDIVQFARGTSGDVHVALSTGSNTFGPATLWHANFAFGQEVPLVGDFNGDERDDVVVFTRGNAGDVYVALSNGSSFVGTGVLWHGSFGLKNEIPAVGDFNGDQRDDIATFTRGTTGDVYVATSTGASFTGTSVLWNGSTAFEDNHPAVGDFNGDGRDDIAVFTRGTTADVFVHLSTGVGFGAFALWHGSFGFNFEIPAIGDVDGNGRDDIITFNRGGFCDVYVAKSNGSSFVGNGVLWHGSFGCGNNIVGVGNFNGGAGRDDIIAFTRGTAADVFVSLSNGNSAFGGVALWHGSFAGGTTVPMPAQVW